MRIFTVGASFEPQVDGDLTRPGVIGVKYHPSRLESVSMRKDLNLLHRIQTLDGILLDYMLRALVLDEREAPSCNSTSHL
jgi:hypothetical protein